MCLTFFFFALKNPVLDGMATIPKMGNYVENHGQNGMIYSSVSAIASTLQRARLMT